MATVAVTILLGIWGVAMSVARGPSECVDKNCPSDQYCFKVSGLCVNYTQCNRINRQNGAQPAQHPSQCGPCLSGYSDEILSTGEAADICKRNVHDDHGAAIPAWGIVLISVVAIFSMIAIVFAMLRIFKRSCRRQSDNKDSKNDETRIFMLPPSAPPSSIDPTLEDVPLDDVENPPSYSSTMNNNKILVDKNKTVRAVPFGPPDWVHLDPGYDLGQDTSDFQEPPSPPPVQPDDDTNPSSWTPQPSTDQVPSRPFSLFGTEQMDNEMNTALARGGCPPTVVVTSPTGGTHNQNGPPTDPGNSGGQRRPNQIVHVNIINQVNVSNDDH